MKTIVAILQKRGVLFLVALCCSFLAMGQVRFTALSSSKEIGRGEYLQVEFVVENAESIEKMNIPSFPDFRVIQGPNETSGMTITNGAMSQYKGLSFVLQPLKPGHFTIPGATAIVNGHPLQSNSLRIVVTVSSTGNSGAVSGAPFPVSGWPPEASGADKDYILKKGEDIDAKIRKNIFVRVQVVKRAVMRGNPSWPLTNCIPN